MATEAKTTVDSASLTRNEDEGRVVMVVQWVFPETHGAKVTRLRAAPQTVGRDVGCDTCLEGEEVSRRHAELRKAGPVHVVRDLGSKNGVHINGERIKQAAFTAGDVLRIGEWVGVAMEVGEGELLEIGELSSGIVGGVAMRAVLERAENAARSDLPIVVQGETGTGKERLAVAIHGWSRRAGPFLAVNCASYSEGLAAAQLFGHKKGAFTGADRASPGHIRAAQGGTLFLDEVAELPLAVQPQLLRVLEQREVLPVGEPRPIEVDVRFVSAVQQPLARLVEQQLFRADLRARLEGVVLRLPPLRARRSDIPFLCQYLLKKHADAEPPALDSRLVERLCVYDWPLNVRELDLLMRRFLALFPKETLLKLSKVSDLLADAQQPETDSSKSAPPAAKTRRETSPYEQSEIEALQVALERCGGNLTRAAAELGITRGKAYRLLASIEKR